MNLEFVFIRLKKKPFFLAWYTIAYILPLFISPSIRNQQTAVIDFNMLISLHVVWVQNTLVWVIFFPSHLPYLRLFCIANLTALKDCK